MNEKELKEMMVSEKTGYGEVEKEINDLKVEIDRMLKKLNEASTEEKVIMDKIRGVLDEHALKYSYDEAEPKHIGIGFSMENKPFKIHIILQNGKVILKLVFPFRVQANAIALMGMYMAKFNSSGTAFSPLSIEFDDGELYMDYAYMVEKPDEFDGKIFWLYMTSHIKFALEIYTKAAHLSVGMVSRRDSKLYKKLLEMALETINGEFDDDNVSYGTESLRSDSHPDLLRLFGEEATGIDRDDSESDEEDSIPDFARDLRRRKPSFEEFMRMKEQAEENDEEELKNQDKKSASVLSMFAKKDESKESKVVGGNEDE